MHRFLKDAEEPQNVEHTFHKRIRLRAAHLAAARRFGVDRWNAERAGRRQ
jgi:hypothetical protein